MFSKSKRGQGLPMNFIIIAIIVLVVLIIIIALVTGGAGSVIRKIQELFTGQISTRELPLAVIDCENLCDQALQLPTSDLQAKSAYCTYTAVVKEAGQLVKYKCGYQARDPAPRITEREKSLGVVWGGNLGKNCDINCGGII